MQYMYMIIMGILIAVAVVLLVVIIVTLAKSRKGQKDYDYEDDYDEDDYDEDDYDEDDYDEDDYDEDEEEELPPRRRSRQQVSQNTQPIPQRRPSSEAQRRAPVKKQWKVILENLDTWEKFTFVFYDNIGIGRGRSNQEFEKYLSVPDDPRASKLHCAIIRKDDKLYLKDMGSRNGTYLNGKRIQQPIIIQRDDIIGLGETKIEVKKVLRERD